MKKSNLKILQNFIFLGCILLALFVNAKSTSNNDIYPKSIDCSSTKKTFRFAQFTDLHFGESDNGDYLNENLMRSIIKKELPDMVMLTGDIISGYAWDSTNGWHKSKYSKAISPMIDHDIPWAMILGNHDHQGEYNSTQIVEHDMLYVNHSLTSKGPEHINGVTNYVITVKYNNDPIVNLWYFDSGDVSCNNDINSWSCVYPNQIEWYKNESIRLELLYKKKLPGYAFIHIPIPELLHLYNNQNITTINNIVGNKKSLISCWKYQTGLFDAVTERGDIISILHGHDHVNDFIGLYNNVLLGYGRKSGYGMLTQFGNPWDWKEGARIMEFSCEHPKNWTTWIRDSDDRIIDKISYKQLISLNKKNNNNSNVDERIIQYECDNTLQWLNSKDSLISLFKNSIYRYTKMSIILDRLFRWKIPDMISSLMDSCDNFSLFIKSKFF